MKMKQFLYCGYFSLFLRSFNGSEKYLTSGPVCMLGTMTLVVRKCVRAFKLKTISGNKGTLNDWGMTLGVFVKEIQPNSFAKKVLHEYDEIIKVSIYVGLEYSNLV